MMNKPNTDYINYIENRLKEFNANPELSQKLSLLTNVDIDIIDLLNGNEANFFYNFFTPQIKRYEISHLKMDDPRMSIIVGYIKYASEEIIKHIKNGDSKKCIILISVLEYFYYPIEKINFKEVNKDLIAEIIKYTQAYKLNIEIPDSAPYHETKSYKDYLLDVENNNYLNIMRFVDSISNLPFPNVFQISLIKLCLQISPETIASYLYKNGNDYISISLVYNSLSDFQVLNLLSNYYCDENIAPLIYYLCNKLKYLNNIYSDAEYFDLYIIMEKIFQRLPDENKIEFFYNNLGLRYSEAFYTMLGIHFAKYPDSIINFSTIIDFKYDRNMGMSLWESCIRNIDDSNLIKICSNIEISYYKFISEEKNITTNQFTSYYNFIINSIVNRCTNVGIFTTEIEVSLKQIYETTMSWDFSNLNYLYHKFFILISANIYLRYELPVDEENYLSQFFRDYRFIPIVGSESFLFMKSCVNNDEIKNIVFRTIMNKDIELQVDRNKDEI